MTTLLAFGSREWTDRQTIQNHILAARAEGVTTVIHGAARGADTIAADAAHLFGLEVTAFRAEWQRYGKRAGSVRNQRMLDEGKPDRAIGFVLDPQNPSIGSADMWRRCKAAGIPVYLVGPGDMP